MVAAGEKELGLKLFTDYEPEIDGVDEDDIIWETPRSAEDMFRIMNNFDQAGAFSE